MDVRFHKIGPMLTALALAVILLVVTTTQSVSSAGVSTDKEDYENGETVVITGSGFGAGSALTVRVTWPPSDGRVDSAAVTADGTGGFTHNYILGLDAVTGTYTVDVLDSSNNVLANTTFSDTHFRYGHITSIPGAGNTVDFIVANAWRHNAYRTGNSRCRDWSAAGIPAIACTGPGSGSGQLPGVGDVIWERQGGTRFGPGDGSLISSPIGIALLYLVTSIDPTNNWLFGVALDPNKLPTANAANAAVITHTYASAGPRIAQISSCCRILVGAAPNGHINNPNQNYRVIDRVVVGSGDSSAVSTLPPIVTCPVNALCNFFVPGADTDGDQLNFRFSTSGEATGFGGFDQPGPPDAPNAATINSTTGLYTWDTTGATLSALTNTLYSTQVTIESLDALGGVNGTVAVDWLITLVPVIQNPPVFDVPPTPDAAGPGCSQTHSVNAGANISYNVQASDPDAGDLVTLNAVGTPPGATHLPGLPTVGNPVSTAFSWTPTAAQVGAHVIVYSATDNVGQQVLCSQTINVTQVIVTADTTPPRCEVLGIFGGELHVEVEDSGSGLDSINVMIADNATVNVPAFVVGTNGVVTVVGTKIDGGAQSRVQLEAFDVEGNRVECDPVLAELNRSSSSPRYSTYDAIPQAERYFTISNTGESTLTYALVNVNDRWFVMPTLLPYEVKTIDIGAALVAGERNTVTVWGGGHRSQVMISDVMPTITNTFVYPDAPLY